LPPKAGISLATDNALLVAKSGHCAGYFAVPPVRIGKRLLLCRHRIGHSVRKEIVYRLVEHGLDVLVEYRRHIVHVIHGFDPYVDGTPLADHEYVLGPR
jgi:hypothetical protein